jgi:DNA-binding NarL/FixJ family response regulator
MPPEKAFGKKKIEILVVDDHPVVREGIRRKIEQQPDMQVCGEASNASEAIARINSVNCDMAVIDISLEGRSGIDLIKQIRSRRLGFPILVLSVHDEVTYVERALAAGAQGYILKEEAPGLIVEGMRHILSGGVFVSPRMAGKLFSRIPGIMRRGGASPPETSLSDREVEVLEGVGRGRSTRQIAHALSLSVSTVETYKSRIKVKLGMKSASELVAYAMDWFTRSGY